MATPHRVYVISGGHRPRKPSWLRILSKQTQRFPFCTYLQSSQSPPTYSPTSLALARPKSIIKFKRITEWALNDKQLCCIYHPQLALSNATHSQTHTHILWDSSSIINLSYFIVLRPKNWSNNTLACLMLHCLCWSFQVPVCVCVCEAHVCPISICTYIYIVLCAIYISVGFTMQPSSINAIFIWSTRRGDRKRERARGREKNEQLEINHVYKWNVRKCSRRREREELKNQKKKKISQAILMEMWGNYIYGLFKWICSCICQPALIVCFSFDLYDLLMLQLIFHLMASLYLCLSLFKVYQPNWSYRHTHTQIHTHTLALHWVQGVQTVRPWQTPLAFRPHPVCVWLQNYLFSWSFCCYLYL